MITIGKRWYLLILGLLIISKLVFPQVVITLKPGPEDGKDAYINTFYTSGNGSTQSFIASAWTYGGVEGIGRSFIEFDLPDLPSVFHNFKAELNLYYDYSSQHVGHGGDNFCKLERVTDEWYENEIDWYNQPSVSNQNTVYLATSLTTDQSYPDIDVTLLIKDAYNDPENSHGLRLSLVDEYVYRSMILASSDHPDEMIRPSLVIRYDTCTLPVDSFSYVIDDFYCQFSYADSSVTSWKWDFGNGYGSDLQNPSYHFIDAGVYNVCVTVENECGSLIICDSVRVCEALEPDFTFTMEGLNVLFTNLTQGVCSYYWDFGNGYFSYVENPEFQFLETGEYQVCLSATNECKTSFTCKTVVLSKAYGVDASISESLIKLYPNPAIGEVFIQSDGLIIHEIKLYDLQGLCRERINTDSVLNEYRLPLPNESPGLYFLHLITDQGTFTRKLFIL